MMSHLLPINSLSVYYLVHGETLPSTEGLAYNLLVRFVFHHIMYMLGNMWAKWHNTVYNRGSVKILFRG